MNALITGVNGFVGPYLKNYLIKKGLNIVGTDISDSDFNADLRNIDQVKELIQFSKPSMVFHLAAISSVKQSWENPELTFDVNVNGTKNLLECLTLLKPKILVISSSEVYGIPKKVPIPEIHHLNPLSPYAKSKVAQEEICNTYKNKLPIIISRSFSHTGPKQSNIFVVPDFAHQIADIEKGIQKATINVGNLDIVRDFSDVRDIVRAYYLLITNGKQGEVYNTCSGKGTNLKDMLQSLISMSKKSIEVTIDKNKFRQSDLPVLIGDNSKLKSLGWKPDFSFEQTLVDTLNWWREKD